MQICEQKKKSKAAMNDSEKICEKLLAYFM